MQLRSAFLKVHIKPPFQNPEETLHYLLPYLRLLWTLEVWDSFGVISYLCQYCCIWDFICSVKICCIILTFRFFGSNVRRIALIQSDNCNGHEGAAQHCHHLPDWARNHSRNCHKVVPFWPLYNRILMGEVSG